ncbi:MAG: amylo-alpha-1,6-glucosidase [Acidobacteriota bacterium]
MVRTTVKLGLVFLAAFLMAYGQQRSTVELFFVADQSAEPETQAALDWLRGVNDIRVRVLSPASLPSALPPRAVLWWHSSDPKVADEEHLKSFLKAWIEQGGRALFTLSAALIPSRVGLESRPPNLVVEAYEPARGRRLFGFQSYDGHPLLQAFHGGAYVWHPTRPAPYGYVGYSGQVWPVEGRVLGVEKREIAIHADRRILIEYRPAKGYAIAAGAYLMFADATNTQRPHLELFTRTLLDALVAGPKKDEGSAWQPRSRDIVLEPDWITMLADRPASSQEVEPSGLSLERPGDDRPFDLSGRRALMVGTQRGRIDDFWTFPVRMIRDIDFGFRPEGSAVIEWLSQSPGLTAGFTARPESARVEASGKGWSARLDYAVDLTNPALVVGITSKSEGPLDLTVRFRGDLRSAWPQPEDYLGSLRFRWDEGRKAVVFSDVAARHTLWAGFSKPPRARVLGAWSPDDFQGGVLRTPQAPRLGLQESASALLQIGLSPGEQVAFVAAGGPMGPRAGLQLFSEHIADARAAEKSQRDYYRGFLEATLDIESPDPVFNQAFRWARVGVDKCFVETPGLGASLMAGFNRSRSGWDPFDARPGYAWYFGRDSVWTAFAVAGYGKLQQVRQALEFLGRYQDVNGKILHEMSSSGSVHYDAADSTPLYVVLMERYWRSTGDRRFVVEQWPKVQKALEFCFSTDTDGDHLIENTGVGHGWVEGGPLFGAHTEIYLAACWAEALRSAAALAQVARDVATARRCEREFATVSGILQQNFLQGGFYSSGKMKDGSYQQVPSVLPAVAALWGLLDEQRTKPHLLALASSEFSTDWGTRMLQKSDAAYNPNSYHGGAVWPLYTGWVALAEYRQHRPLQAYVHTMNNLLLFRGENPGYIDELYNGDVFLRQGVCPHQGWSESMAVQPVIDGMLGLRPDAAGGRVTLEPHLPRWWGQTRVRSIRVGETILELEVQQEAERLVCWLRKTTGPSLTVRIGPALPAGLTLRKVEVDGKAVEPEVTQAGDDQHANVELQLTGAHQVVWEHPPFVSVIAPMPAPEIGQPSRGLKILDEARGERSLEILVEGVVDRSYQLELLAPLAITEVTGATLERQGDGRALIGLKLPAAGAKTAEQYVRGTVKITW